jgi:2-polyprenyl-3-methyl-5-hydroxy-6-metoxy-1,4-benzoquinol methylase
MQTTSGESRPRPWARWGWANRLHASLRPSVRQDWSRPYEILRNKWGEVPATNQTRHQSRDFLDLDDKALLNFWLTSRDEQSTGPAFDHRGWYQALYTDALRDKEVLDVGSGLGFSSLTFAQHGARVTFLDLHPDNLAVVERVAGLLGLDKPRCVLLEDLSSLDALAEYDAITAIGSLHHAPSDVIRPEARSLLRHLRVGGRWLQFAYPRGRWQREGKLPFSRWGESTDGVGTPWAEWYDVPKLLDLLAPGRFEVVLYHEFGGGAFNWFDLLYRGGGQQ